MVHCCRVTTASCAPHMCCRLIAHSVKTATGASRTPDVSVCDVSSSREFTIKCVLVHVTRFPIYWLNVLIPGTDVYVNCCVAACACSDVGAVSSVCDKTSGQCACADNVDGRQCDKCADNHHDLTSSGCQRT